MEMETDSKRRQVSLDQLNALVDFLKEHQELAKGLTRGRRGKLHTLKLWNLCAKKLNVFKDGAHKDGKGWSKYWCDWKYRVRRRALELKAAQDSNRPLPDGITTLSGLEEKIMSIIGESSLEGVVIKCDPLGVEETLEESNVENHNDGKSGPSNSASEPGHSGLRKRHTSRDEQGGSDLNDMDCQGGPSSPPDKKPRVCTENSQDSDDDSAAQFLELERQKLNISRNIQDSLQIISSELTKLTDIMNYLKDVLADRF